MTCVCCVTAYGYSTANTDTSASWLTLTGRLLLPCAAGVAFSWLEADRSVRVALRPALPV